jgi:hypothetical protein
VPRADAGVVRPWTALDATLRSLTVSGDGVRYEAGCNPDARLYFTDAGMLHVPPESYPLLDLDTRQPLEPMR